MHIIDEFGDFLGAKCSGTSLDEFLSLAIEITSALGERGYLVEYYLSLGRVLKTFSVIWWALICAQLRCSSLK